jgi:hypothetical protein
LRDILKNKNSATEISEISVILNYAYQMMEGISGRIHQENPVVKNQFRGQVQRAHFYM